MRVHGLLPAASKEEEGSAGTRLCSFPLGAREPLTETDARAFPAPRTLVLVDASRRR